MNRTNRIGSRAGVAVLAFVCWMVVSTASALAASGPALAGTPLSGDGTSGTPDLAGAVAVAVGTPQPSGHTYAYVPASNQGQLTAIDVSNPATLVETGTSAAQPVPSPVANASNIALANGNAYVTSKNHNLVNPATGNDDGSGNALTIMDLTNPAQPTFKGSIRDTTTLFGAYGIAVQGNYAFVAAQGVINGDPQTPDTSTGAFTVVNVSNPASPSIVTSISNDALPGTWAGTNALQHVTSVAISGNVAYVTAAYGNRLTAINISNPTSPTIVGSVLDNTNLDFPVDVATQGHYAYVADQGAGTGHSQGLTVVDISNPASPRVVGVATSTWLNSAYRIRVRGNFAYVSTFHSNTVSAVDISDPANPRFAGGIFEMGYLNATTGLDLDPTSRYVIATSPNQPGGSPIGTVSAYTLDPSAPHVGIHSGSEPPSTTTQTSADFTFVTGNQVVTMRCSLDGAPPGLCTTPGDQQYTGLGLGRHTFTVQAIDTAGTIASDSWTWTIIKDTPPSVVIKNPTNGDIFSLGETGHARYSCTAGNGTSLKSCTGPVANGARIDTSHVGHHTFTVIATDKDGLMASATVHYTVIAGPVLTGVGQLHKRWRETKKRGPKRVPVGTRFTFRLNEPSRVTLAFTRPGPGRRVHRQCVAPTKRNAHKRSCRRAVVISTIVFKSENGPVTVSFTGWASHRLLKPGAYNFVITATAGGHSSVSKPLSFSIVA